MNNIFPFKGIMPTIGEHCFIAPTASIIGKVEIGEYSSVWFNTVLRGDVEKITIGSNTNIQDGTVIHVTNGGFPTKIGSYVTIGHKALLHACTLEDNSFIGMDSTIMDRAIVESGGWVAAGSLVTEGKVIKSGEVWAGRPARFFRNLTPEESAFIESSARNYVTYSREYL